MENADIKSILVMFCFIVILHKRSAFVVLSIQAIQTRRIQRLT